MDAVTIGFACYLTMILIVGFYTAQIINNLKDFALGGKRLGPTVSAFLSGLQESLPGRNFYQWGHAAMMSTTDSQLLLFQ